MIFFNNLLAKMPTWFFLCSTIFISNCKNKSNNYDQNKELQLAGYWELISMQKLDSDGKIRDWQYGTKGYLLYDNNGHVALHLTTNNYDSFPVNFPNFNNNIDLQSLKHLTNNYNYTGFYEVKDSLIMHHKVSHSNPKEWGTTAIRKYWFSGDTLCMVPIESKNSTLLLKWKRKTR